jgi:hypothetical protein
MPCEYANSVCVPYTPTLAQSWAEQGDDNFFACWGQEMAMAVAAFGKQSSTVKKYEYKKTITKSTVRQQQQQQMWSQQQHRITLCAHHEAQTRSGASLD